MTHPHANRPVLPTSDAAARCARRTGALARGVTGSISDEDGGFVLTLLERTGPAHIVEVGVAAGTSSLMMLAWIQEAGLPASMDSIDLLRSYYGDPRRPVGYLVAEHLVEVPRRWRLLTGATVAEVAGHPLVRGTSLARRYDFAFIDAHHAHPWPALDLLCLLPYLRPGSWVALHDINLPRLGDYPQHGADYLMRDWEGEALVADHLPLPNTGAIRLTDAGSDDAARLAAIVARPWDVGIHRRFASRIRRHVAGFAPAAVRKVVDEAFSRHARLPAG